MSAEICITGSTSKVFVIVIALFRGLCYRPRVVRKFLTMDIYPLVHPLSCLVKTVSSPDPFYRRGGEVPSYIDPSDPILPTLLYPYENEGSRPPGRLWILLY